MGKVAEIWIEVGAKLDSFNKGMTDTQGAMQKVGRELDATGAQMQKVGLGMVALGGSMLAMGGIALKAFGNFDAAMTQSTAIMGDLSVAMRRDMVDAAKDVAKTTTFSAKEAGQAFFYLASAGLDAKASIAALPVVSKFAQAGMFDMALATDLLTDAQSALGLSIRDDAVANMENMIRVGDVLVKANVLANATVQQFSESLTNRAGPALRMVGKDVEEGVAVLAAFADQGIKGAEAGTRLDIVLRDLQVRTIKNREAFEKYGVSVYDSSGEMRNMADIIRELEVALAGQSDEKKRQILMEMEFQDRSVASILALVGMSGQIREYEKGLRDAGGTMEEVARKQLETLNAQFKLAKNNIEIAAITIGEKLAPAAMDIAKKIQEVTKGIVAWMDKHPKLIEGIVKTGMALGAFLTAGGAIIVMLGTLLRNLGAILVILPKIKLAFSGILGPVGLVTTAIAVLIERSIAFVNAYKKMAETIDKAAAQQGEKVGWLEKRWASLNAAYYKVFQGIDVVKAAQESLTRSLTGQEKPLSDQEVAIRKWQDILIHAGHSTETIIARLRELKKTGEEGVPWAINYSEALKEYHMRLVEQGFTTEQIIRALEEYKKRLREVSDETGETGKASSGLAKLFEDLGVKTRDQLMAELKKAEEALAALNQTGQATPGVVRALEDRIKSLGEELFGTRDILSELGIIVIPRKKEKIKELREALSELEKAYKAGKITLADYEQATRKVRSEIESLRVGIDTMAVPAVRNLSGVMDKVVSKFDSRPYRDWGETLEKYGTLTVPEVAKRMQELSKDMDVYRQMLDAGVISQGQFEEIMKRIQGEMDTLQGVTRTTTKTVSDHFAGLYNDIAQGWANTIQNWIEGAMTWKDFTKSIFEDVKKAFFRVVGEMIAKWLVDFVKRAADSVLDIGKSIAQNITGAAKVGTEAIGTATKAASSFAKVIDVVGLAAMGLGVLISALKKGPDFTYTNRLLEEQNWVYLQGIGEKLNDVNEKLAGMWTITDNTYSVLEEIANAVVTLPAIIKDAVTELIKVLSSKGTVYVDVFRSDIIDKFGSNLSAGMNNLGGNISNAVSNLGGNIFDAVNRLGKDIAGGISEINISPAISAQKGWAGTVTEPIQYFKAHRGEEVRITPAGRDETRAGASVTLQINSPLISVQSIADSDIRRLGDKLYSEIKHQARRVGKEL